MTRKMRIAWAIAISAGVLILVAWALTETLP
jgi:hypothetical protein